MPFHNPLGSGVTLGPGGNQEPKQLPGLEQLDQLQPDGRLSTASSFPPCWGLRAGQGRTSGPRPGDQSPLSDSLVLPGMPLVRTEEETAGGHKEAIDPGDSVVGLGDD